MTKTEEKLKKKNNKKKKEAIIVKTILHLYLVHLLKNKTVFSECARPYSPDYGIFMQSTERAVQH